VRKEGGYKQSKRGIGDEDSGGQGKGKIPGTERHFRIIQNGIDSKNTESGREF
jgi:hypothetical protein